MIQYLQRTEIVDEHYARMEDSRNMPVELLIDFESITGICIPGESQELRTGPRAETQSERSDSSRS